MTILRQVDGLLEIGQLARGEQPLALSPGPALPVGHRHAPRLPENPVLRPGCQVAVLDRHGNLDGVRDPMHGP